MERAVCSGRPEIPLFGRTGLPYPHRKLRRDGLPVMKPISAIDAISPAFTRMRQVLASPFRLGTFLKIALAASFAEVGAITVSVQLPVQVLTQFASVMKRGSMPHGVQMTVLVGSLVVMAIFSVVWLVLGYVFTRLRFVVFDFVAKRTTRVGEAWALYGRQSGRFFGLNLLVLLVLMTGLLALAGPFVIALLKAAQTQNPAAILPHMLALFVGGVVVSFVVQMVDSVLRDFVLPQMALEDASIEDAVTGSARMMRDHPGEVILYLLLKFAVTLGFSFVLALAVLLAVGVLGVGLGGVGFGIYALLWSLGLVGRAVVITYAVMAGALLLGLYLLGLIAASGISGVFRAAYAVYFFGSRYPPLGNLLEPPALPVELAPEPEPSLPGPLPVPPAVW